MFKGLGVFQVPLFSLFKILEMESNGVDDIITIFNDYSLKNPDMPKTVAAIKALTDSIETSSASTMMELKKSLEKASDVLKSTSSNFSLMAACDLFLSYVTRCFLEFTVIDYAIYVYSYT